MGQLQKVSWRTVGYAALGTVVAAASVVAIINSDGVRPTSLTSNAATRWLVDQLNNQVVLVDGLAGHVVAKVTLDTETGSNDDVAVQGPGGAFLVAPSQGSVRTISTAKLQLGTAQTVGLLSEAGAKFRVGTSGLTILSPHTKEATVVAVDDVTQPMAVPESDSAYLAADGSMWLLSKSQATHVNVDDSRTTVLLRSSSNGKTTTIGSRAVTFDAADQVMHWLGGSNVAVTSLPNPSEAVMQEPGDDAPCVWIGSGDTLLCVGKTGIDHTLTIRGMGIGSTDRLAIAGPAAVVVRNSNRIDRIDLEGEKMANDQAPTTPSSTPSITASGNLIWLDEPSGTHAWVVHRFGINPITKDDVNALTFDAQGQVQDAGNGGDAPSPAGGNGGADETSHLDLNGREDPPTAVDDSVTARADTTITIPVTGNDWDPDGDPIAVDSAGIGKQATHGTVDVLNGTSVSYKPDPGYSGLDSFEYTIVDPSGEGDTATVNVQLFPPGSPNQPPIARADKGFKTRIGRAITIDVLANDIDPERDVLRIATFTPNGSATISETKGPTGLPALRYQPPSTAGIYTFTYQAADPQGGTSPKTQVTVEVSGADAANGPPVANPDAIRLPVGVPVPLDVKANDTDPDGDELTISLSSIGTDAIDVSLQAQQLSITVRPGAKDRSLVFYTLSDGIKEHDKRGEVLVLRIGDTAENRAPVANPDAERVVIGESVKIPVTANDIDPDHDIIRLLTAGTPTGGAGTTIVEGNAVRFTPNLPDIKEPTPVTFTYTITDGNGHEATGNVTVTVLLEALPRAPFARDDFADTEVDKPVNIDVLANDGDPSGGGQPSLTGNPTCPNGGTASRTPDERITYVPPSGQPGTFRCKYTVINRQGLVAEASIIVTVNPALPGNHDPQINATNTLPTVDLGTTLSIFAADIATDADNDHLVFVSVDNPLNGKAEIRQNGDSILYTAPAIASAEKTPTAVNVSFTISDGNDGNVSGSVSVKINDPSATTSTTPTGTAPATHDIAKNATVGDLVQVDVLFELRESNPSTLTVGPVNLDSGPGSALQVSPIGVVSVIVTGPGNVVIGYTVANSDNLLSSTGKIKITVNEAQTSGSPPVANDDEMIVASGGSGRIDLLANDSGYSDPGDVLDIKLILRPPADFGSVTLIGSQLTFVAAGNTSGDTNLTYELSDGSGVSVGHVKITLKACVDSPPATTGAQLFTPYQTPISIDLNQYVVSGSIRSVIGAGLTGATGVYTPPAGFNGVETVTYTVANGCGQTVEGTVTIDVNRIPVGDDITRALAHGDQLLLHVNELASDDEPLKITVLNGNPGWVSWDETTVSATPPASASGDYTFTATVVDPGGLTATASITLRVTNLAPTAFADQFTTDDSTFSFDPTENDFDPEGGLLCVQPVNVDPPNGSAIVGPNPAPTCLKSITISLVHGVTHLTYTVRDEGGLTASSTITITSNRPPTVPDATGATNGFPSVDIPLLPTEPDGDDVSVTCNTPVDGDGPNANFDVGISPNLNAGDNPKIHPRYKLSVSVQQPFQPGVDDQFHCTVTDSFGRAAVATVTITNS